MQELYTQSATYSSSLEVSKVLRNTYALLAMTIGFSAITATISMAINFPHLGLISLLPYIGLLFAVEKTKNSGWGIVWVFALTGWLGLTLGPILNYYVGVSGIEPILMALGGTALIFFGLSGYVLVTRKDLSFLTGFIMTGFIVAFVAMLAAYFLNISGLSLAVSCMFLVLSSLLIMWQTSNIIHGGETNYISATVTLYVSLYNIFTILLSFLGGSSDD
ncbi:Bax inhibitor-1/YccA family protein [Teredinibacter waterburyi]|jgi:Integral membrane protein, interacts with FtsH|uniref:Bax inhibitor-1/YccA family protein n=1 Tax=Teredinibacter waterburyi TaxID=1500538 RepID=UPI00165F7BFF|nr:Bax inhibitor-1/YccA family protein [Teredinibacter waterburyi]